MVASIISTLFFALVTWSGAASGTDNRKTTDVTWDKYSLSIIGKPLLCCLARITRKCVLSGPTDYNNVGGAVDIDAVFYDGCESSLSIEFAAVYSKNDIGSHITMLGIYMTFGGTNWGHVAALVCASYGYTTMLRETGEARDKMKQTKFIGLFACISTDLFKTEMEGNGTSYTGNNKIFTWVLRNPDTDAGFYAMAPEDTSTRATAKFALNLKTSYGQISIPDVQLDGRQSKIILTDYQFGNSTFLYSSAEVASYANLDVDVLVPCLTEESSPSRTLGSSDLTISSSGKNGLSYLCTQGECIAAVKFSSSPLIYLLDKHTAWNFFAPPTTSNPPVAPNEHISVIGPCLVRNAYVQGDSVEIVGGDQNHAP
ncbi:hypothetical protein AJ80_00242 [Polytolypa hystricis UAMH7299]|uniref:Beta-galactosidase domain-containing protein n=1 Tax=Polytolypa hystricis (strain UAMH7299) TaxID=1447883 RepID=A0A2B7Z567_POLH7|nr:hypothetical protein AJ80_00242 [Polytolypa hystricis UAMH7299]